MNINCIDSLGRELKEKLRVTKKNCLTLTNIPYSGVKHEIAEEDRTTTIYSLLPGLEDVQLIERTDKENTKVYMTKSELVANISKESLDDLLVQINIATASMENRGMISSGMITIPEEIINNLRTMNHISLKKLPNELDSLYTEYTTLIATIRELQTKKTDFIKSL